MKPKMSWFQDGYKQAGFVEKSFSCKLIVIVATLNEEKKDVDVEEGETIRSRWLRIRFDRIQKRVF